MILTIKSAAEKFGVNPHTTYKIFRTKGSPAFKVGREWHCDEDELIAYLKRQSEGRKG